MLIKFILIIVCFNFVLNHPIIQINLIDTKSQYSSNEFIELLINIKSYRCGKKNSSIRLHFACLSYRKMKLRLFFLLFTLFFNLIKELKCYDGSNYSLNVSFKIYNQQSTITNFNFFRDSITTIRVILICAR